MTLISQMFSSVSFLIVLLVILTYSSSSSSSFLFVDAWLGCTDPPKHNPQMIETALHKFYDNCDGKNWPGPYQTHWKNPILCALDGDVRKHPSPVGTRCAVGPPWHKLPPEADGGLMFLEMFSGKVKGTLPEEFKAFQMVDFIGLWNNSITGNLWDTSFHCFLHRLDLSHNQMSGILNEKTFFTNSKRHLELLNLGYNKFTGPIPATMNNLETLAALVLRNNKFSGKIPDLSHLSKLRQLDVANNELSGEIGLWLKELTNLAVINLDGNPGINGRLPLLPESVMRFSASGTGFAGEIPSSYGELPYLRHFNCSGCSLACPKPDLFAHLLFSTHCKPKRVWQ